MPQLEEFRTQSILCNRLSAIKTKPCTAQQIINLATDEKLSCFFLFGDPTSQTKIRFVAIDNGQINNDSDNVSDIANRNIRHWHYAPYGPKTDKIQSFAILI